MTPLTLLYQDEFLVAIDKPPGMLVHPGREPEGNEWIAMKRLRDQLERRVYPVHRLDRPTAGVLLFALDKRTAGLVQQAFEHRRVTKIYQALVEGIFPEHWTCDSALQATEIDPFLPAHTAFERLKIVPAGSFPGEPALGLSLVRAQPTTGRFHQIRRHLAGMGFPIVGDFRYADRDRSFQLGAILGTDTRMMLQAKSLTLAHPHTGQVLQIEAAEDPKFIRCFPPF